MWSFLLVAVLFASGLGLSLATSGVAAPIVAVHASLMITAWALLMPAGGIAARYFKVTPGQDFPRVVENLTWWRWHRWLQYGGTALSTVALGAILSETGGRLDTLHGRCGLAVMVLGWAQVVSGLLRGSKGGPTDHGAAPLHPATWRGDHYDMTPRRRAFEAWHKPAGWAAIALAGVAVLLGLQLIGSPSWLAFVLGMLHGGICASVLDGAVRRRRVDTYASLWGPDPRHPGNRPPVRGERRPAPTSQSPHR